MTRAPILILLLALLGSEVLGEKTCYDCGYMCKNLQDGPCVPEPITEDGSIHFCKDTLTMDSMRKECAGSDECCGSLVEFLEIKDENTGEVTINKITYHGCEKDLAPAIGNHVEVVCGDYTNACYNVSNEDVHEDFVQRAEACFCEGDLCNNNTPDLPDNEITEGPSKTCYNCGYKCTDMSSGTCMPEAIDSEGKIPFCGDSASMESSTKQCAGTDECCGVLREYLEVETNGTNKVDMLTFHGCEKDLAGALSSHVEVICSDHANSCFNVSTENIEDEFLTEAEACFCEGDLCNKDIPDLPFPDPLPTDGPAPGAHKCYNCGYKCSNIVGNVCTPETLGPDAPFCGDVAGMGSMTKECAGAETECCGSLKEFFEVKDEQSGETRIDMFAFHGCEGDLEHALNVQVAVVCSGHENTCYNVSRDTIDDTEIIRAEACFCDGDLCNNNLPDLPDPEPTNKPTDAGPSKTCYNCGYRCTDMSSGACTPEHIDNEGKVPFCGDSATMESSTKQCGGTDECCGVLREYFELVVDGKDRTDMLTFHGCEKDLAGALQSHVEVICSDHANSCFNVSTENIEDEFLTEAEACFCDGDLCNKDLPDLPFPPPLPTDGQPTDAPCPECVKCYSCGYKKDGLDGEMGSMTDVPFCNDFATEDTVVPCGKDDCCGMLKEYFIKVDADGNNSTEIIGRHGCAADIDHLGHYSATCEKNGESCWEVEDDSLDHDHDDGHTIFQAEICLCGHDRCNVENPIPEIPTTTAAPGSGSQVASTLLTLLLSLCLQI